MTDTIEEIRARHEAGWGGKDVFALMAEMNDDRATLLRLLSEERARRVEAEGALGSLESLLPGPMAWLERWADHVGNCAGGHLCTCGLQLARYELFSAIQALPATHKDTQDE